MGYWTCKDQAHPGLFAVNSLMWEDERIEHFRVPLFCIDWFHENKGTSASQSTDPPPASSKENFLASALAHSSAMAHKPPGVVAQGSEGHDEGMVPQGSQGH